MIRALSQYALDEVLGRLWRILLGTEVLIALMIGGATAIFGSRWGLARLKPADVSTTLLTYAAIAFGFCISGMALVLTLPNQDFVMWLVKERLGRKGPNAYSDLLFVFSWTAVCHWLLVILAFALLAFGGERNDLLNGTDYRSWRSFVGVVFGVAIYSAIQFLLTLITLSQVGRLYIARVSDSAGNMKN